MGPILVTADEIPDPQALAISLRVNGQVRQSSNTSKMIFPVDQCIEVLSQGMTAPAGDIIATGTPTAVVGRDRNFLKVGGPDGGRGGTNRRPRQQGSPYALAVVLKVERAPHPGRDGRRSGAPADLPGTSVGA
jgi:hypothetical protein